MFELYVRCPSTGEPVYAGMQPGSDGCTARSDLMGRSICPACGSEHEWQTAAVWSAIPITLSPVEEPLFGTPILETLPPDAPGLSFEPLPPELAWPKVA